MEDAVSMGNLASWVLTDKRPLTVGESGLLGCVWSSRCSMPPPPLFERRSKAALHFPANIRSAKDRAIVSVDFGVEVLGILH